MSLPAEAVELRASAQETVLDPRWPRFVYPQIASLEAIQAAQSKFFDEHPDEPVITLDMRGCTDISLLTIVDMESLLFSRAENQDQTFILLPQSQKARDVFHQWNFVQSHFDSHGLFWSHLPEIDPHFFREEADEAQRRNTPLPVWKNFPKQWNELAENFFAFRTVSPQDTLSEIQRWRKSLIGTLLNNQLRENSEAYFVGTVVYESLTNAKANLVEQDGSLSFTDAVQIASRFHDPDRTGASRNFTYVVWDQGKSIIDRVGSSSKTLEYWKLPPIIEQTYYVTQRDEDGNSNSYEMNSGYRAHQGSIGDSDFLFAWLQLSRFGHGREEPALGIRHLVNAACDVFGGEVIVCTGRYRMNITGRPESLKPGNGYHYDVSIHTSSKNAPEFFGNLVAVRLPLKPQDAVA